MAGVNPPGYAYPAPPALPEPPPRRRWWLVAIVVAWAVALGGFAAWSVRHDPPTVPEQRDIAAALPVLERAAGFLITAADGGERVVTLGALEFDRDCAVTPVRAGVEASREVTVRVRAGQAAAALDAIARALPQEYAPTVRRSAAGTRLGLRADAGGFVSVEATLDADATVFGLRAVTGCRPLAAGVDLAPAPVPATDVPAAFGAVVGALGLPRADATSSTVACPAGGKTARTVAADDLAAPADLGRSLRDAMSGAVIVQAEPAVWAYRTGDISIVVSADEGRARITATTGCR